MLQAWLHWLLAFFQFETLLRCPCSSFSFLYRIQDFNLLIQGKTPFINFFSSFFLASNWHHTINFNKTHFLPCFALFNQSQKKQKVAISPPLYIKLTMGQLLLLFLWNFCSFFSYVKGVLVTNLSSLLLIDIFWLFSKLYHTRSICDNLFYLKRSSELPQKRWHHSHNNRKWLKQPQSNFYEAITHKCHHFSLFWCILCTATQIFQVQAKISTIRPVFPGYVSVSYEHDSTHSGCKCSNVKVKFYCITLAT